MPAAASARELPNCSVEDIRPEDSLRALFAFSVLPVLLAALHVRLDTSAKDRLWKIEVYLIYLFMLGVGASGLSGFFGHVFTPDAVAESIDWPKGSPFQQEMGFANLALGVLGFIAACAQGRLSRGDGDRGRHRGRSVRPLFTYDI